MTHSDDPQPPAAPRSIWEPLDGSEPRHEPVLPAQPTAFQRPPAQPLSFPGVAPQPRAEGEPPTRTADGRAVFVLASWGSRFGAWLVDGILLGVIALCFTVPVGLALGLTVEETLMFFSSATIPDSASSTAPLYAAYAAQLLLPALFSSVFLTRWNGQTPGKRLLNLRVVRADGEPMNTTVAFRREILGKTVLMLVAATLTLGIAALLNYLWPLWDKQNRAGHDVLAGTRVVAAPRDER